MALQSGFFRSIGGDRRYKADFFASYFSSFIGNGVFPNPSSGLQVTAGTNLTVNVQPGKGWINGYYLISDSQIPLTLDNADGILNRIDRVVMRWDIETRMIDVVLKKGTPGTNPIAPTLQRDASIYELALADIRLNNGTTAISQVNIVDTRLNTQLCGIVSGVVNQVDTTSIFNQYEQSVLEVISNNQQQFDDFLASIEGQLDGDIAGNLLNQINQLRADLTQHEGLNASTTQRGHVQLNNTVTSTSTSTAATANAVKTAYDRAEAAFQSANNGKLLIANAIIGKGQNANQNDTFQQLATAITNISTGTKSASGSIPYNNTNFREDVQFTSNSGVVDVYSQLTINTLDFRPRLVLIMVPNSSYANRPFTIYYQDASFTTSGTSRIMLSRGNNTSNTGIQLTGNASITDNGFSLPFVKTGTGTINWIAFE